MAIWIYRAGKEHEEKFLNDGRIYLTWKNLNTNLNMPDEQRKEIVAAAYPWWSKQQVESKYGMVYPIVNAIAEGDWIMVPSKLKTVFHFGKVIGPYEFDPEGPERYKHYRRVEWFATDISRDLFDNQILYDTNVHFSVFKLKNEEVINRIIYMKEHNWEQPQMKPFDDQDYNDEWDVDWDAAAKDTISKYIYKKFKGYDMENLICEILRAKGFTVYNSPKGPDGGQDLLAAAGDMGFESPKICVQVKTQKPPVKKEVVEKLSETIEKFHAEYGLFVSWNGYEKAVDPAKYFYNIRLWTSKEVVEELLANYEKISSEMQQLIPLKHIWILNEYS